MSENLVVNGKTYTGVESIEMQNSEGETVQYFPDAVRYVAQPLTEAQKAQARKNIGLTGVEPAENDIPKVFFGADLPQTKDDTIMSFRYISKTADIKGYCKTKAQGSSSMSYPKKNQTVKLYWDADCTQKMKVNFKGWGEQNKFCFKANWIDITHARNIVSARLWGDVVKSRANYADIPELLRTSPNQGAIDGFPVKVYANGVYQGRYTINIPKDAWMANMDDELDTHCILCGESNVDDRCMFRATASIDGTDWSDEVHDTVPDAIKARWNEAINFINTSTDDEFVAGIGNYFDVPSLIDYYLVGLVFYLYDNFGKNQLYMTYDGLKLYATIYDADCGFGLWFDGSDILYSYTLPRENFTDMTEGSGNLLYIRLAALFGNAIKERWEYLRSDVLTFDNIMNKYEEFISICPPYLVEEDYAPTTAKGAFTEIPSTDKNNIQQIRDFTLERLAWFNDLYAPKPLYSLENGTWNDTGAGLAMTITNGNHIRFTGTNAASGENWLALNPGDVWNSNMITTLFSIPVGGEVVFKRINTVVNSGNAPTGNLYMTKVGGGKSTCWDVLDGSMGEDKVSTAYPEANEDIYSIGTYLNITEPNFDFEYDLEIYVNGVRYI